MRSNFRIFSSGTSEGIVWKNITSCIFLDRLLFTLLFNINSTIAQIDLISCIHCYRFGLLTDN